MHKIQTLRANWNNRDFQYPKADVTKDVSANNFVFMRSTRDRYSSRSLCLNDGQVERRLTCRYQQDRRKQGHKIRCNWFKGKLFSELHRSLHTRVETWTYLFYIICAVHYFLHWTIWEPVWGNVSSKISSSNLFKTSSEPRGSFHNGH